MIPALNRCAPLAAAVLLACSGEDMTELPEQESPARNVPLLDPVDPSSPARLWNDDPHTDAELFAPAASEAEDKSTVVLLHGWAVNSTLKQRCVDGSGNPISPCQWHYEPTDTFIGGFTDFANDTPGRCGKELGTGSPRACLLPHALDTTAGKTWRYYISFGDCPNDSARRASMRIGVRAAFAAAGTRTGWTFTEVSSPPSIPVRYITVRCAAGSEIQWLTDQDALATGSPAGQLTFTHAAPFGTWEGDCTPPGPYPHLADTYFYYLTGTIALNWDYFWEEFVTDECFMYNTGDIEFKDRAVKYTILHEIGHVLGFQHHTRHASDPESVMFPLISCARAELGTDEYFWPMRDALNAIDIPRRDEALTVQSTSISCLGPT